MKSSFKISAMWLTTAFLFCFVQIVNAQPWTGSTTIYTTDLTAKVGIGTSSPTTRLHVKGFGNLFQLQATGTYNYMTFNTPDGPKGTLGVYNGANDMDFGTASGNSLGKINFIINAVPKMTIASSVSDTEFGNSAGNSAKMHFVTGGTRRMTVLPTSGNVGIGILDPTAQLHVKGSTSTPLKVESTTSTNTMEYFTGVPAVKKGYTTVNATDMEFGTVSGNSAKLHFVTGGARRMTVLPSTGYVGIGIASPQNQLHVKGTGIPFRLESTNPAIKMEFYTPDGVKGYAGIFSSNPSTPPNMDFGTLGGTLGNVNLVINSTPCLTVFNNSNVGIGTVISNSYKLSVNGTIRAKEVHVETGWADYVFDENFRLRPLAEVEQFIQANKHLPDVTPAADIQKDGLQVAKQMTEMMQKVEELTLYVIQLDKENAALRARVGALEAARK